MHLPRSGETGGSVRLAESGLAKERTHELVFTADVVDEFRLRQRGGAQGCISLFCISRAERFRARRKGEFDRTSG